MPVYIVFDWYHDDFLKSLQKKIVRVYTSEEHADKQVSQLITQRYLKDVEDTNQEIENIERRGIRNPKTKKISYVVPDHLKRRKDRELADVEKYAQFLKNICELPYYEEQKLCK